MDVTGGTGRLQGKQVLVTGGTTGIGFAIAGRFLHEGARVMVTGPVRVYQDFATVDLLSHGRAEITAGRSAFTEPFGIFGADLPDYDALFSEKLDLLLHLRENDHVTWSGKFRAPLADAPITPRALQEPLPVWLGVGGSPESAERAGRLGLPMVLGYIGGPLVHARRAVDIYRAAGDRAGHPDPGRPRVPRSPANARSDPRIRSLTLDAGRC